MKPAGPIQHNGDIAAYLRDLGVQQVTAQDIDPLLTPTVAVADATQVGPGFVVNFRAYSYSVGGPGAGAHNLLWAEAGPKGSYLQHANNGSLGGALRIWIGRTENIKPGAPTIQVNPVWDFGFTNITAQASVQLTANLPNGAFTGMYTDDFSGPFDYKGKVFMPPGFGVLLGYGANVAGDFQLIVQDVP